MNDYIRHEVWKLIIMWWIVVYVWYENICDEYY